MTTDERVDAIAKTLEHVTGVVASLAGTVAAHDRQIGAILIVIEKHDAEIGALQAGIAELKGTVADLTREWQAYLRRIPPQ